MVFAFVNLCYRAVSAKCVLTTAPISDIQKDSLANLRVEKLVIGFNWVMKPAGYEA